MFPFLLNFVMDEKLCDNLGVQNAVIERRNVLRLPGSDHTDDLIQLLESTKYAQRILDRLVRAIAPFGM